jgi:hypothetical protein
MKKTLFPLLIATTMSLQAAHAAAPDAAKYVKEQGGHIGEFKVHAHSPDPDVVPVVFYAKGNSVPSCGLVTARSGSAAPGFIELVGSDPGVDFPQCLNIESMVPFKLQGRDYIAVEYVSRETREDVYRNFSYVVRDGSKGFLLDEALGAGGEGDETTVGAPSKPAEGVKRARIAAAKKAFPQWQLQERDFISDKASSFAIFDDRKAQQCHVVAEAGAAPVAASLTDYAPGARCAGVLASTRLEKTGTNYYMAMFKSDGAKHMVTVTSVAPDGKVACEKGLSETINKSGATRDIKSAKAALAAALR